MKRLLALVLLLALVGAASATSLNFQNPDDFTQITQTKFTAGNTEFVWVESGIGGNNYVSVYSDGTGNGNVFHLVNPSQTAYAAATLIGGDQWVYNDGYIALMDSSKTVMFDHAITSATTGRYEVKISGGIPKIYRDGVVVKTGTALAQNPSYVGFGSYARGWAGRKYWDDYVYGDTENKLVLALPESDDNKFIILDDLVNNAADGLYNTTSGTQANANIMVGTWSRGNSSFGAPLENQSITLVNYDTKTVYWTGYTGLGFAGTFDVPIKTNLIDAGAPDGFYALTSPGMLAYSNLIMKKSNGAKVTFNKDTYSTGDTATVITYVAAGGYWDTSTYEYKLSLYGLSAGYVENYTITSQSGSFTHAWKSTDIPGVYYAILYATSRSTGKEAILGLDWATLSSYAGYSGYVNNAQTGATISGAFVNMTQDGVSGNSTSGFDGNWSTGSVFNTGAILTINASASGYIPYNYSWTPLAARTVSGLNISMVPSTPTFTGLAIGGVDRDFLYGRPIEGATVTVRNTTTGLYCYKTTSFTGWYLNDETDCLFQSKTPYDVWAYKVGYTNSTTERAVTA